MKKVMTLLISMAVFLSLSNAAISSQYNMSLHKQTITTADGIVTSAPAANANATSMIEKKQATELADGVFRIAGWGIGHVIAVKGPEGWIIIDSGDNVKQATEQRAMLEKTVGHKIKVAAVMYTHSHYVWGATVWVEEGTKVYGHEDLVKNLMADSGISPLSGNVKTRAVIQFGILHPKQGPDAFPNKYGFGRDKLTGEKGFVPPMITFKDGQIETHMVGGLKVEVLPNKTDVLDSVAYYFPQKKMLTPNGMISDAIFNLYTLRGDIYRDPMRLVKAADLALSRDIELLVDIHGKPHVGKEKAVASLEIFRDTMQLIHDQTFRAIAQGKDAQGAAESIYLPKALRVNREFYGQVESHVKQVYAGRIGWMGWDVYDINPLPKAEQAANIVNGMGGFDTVLAAAKAANAQKKIPGWQWSLYLTSQLLEIDSSHPQVKAVRAKAARALGQHTTSANARGFYISEALLHEGNLAMGKQPITEYQQLSRFLGAVTAKKLAKSPLKNNIDYLRYMIDTRLAEGKRIDFNLSFTDQDAKYAVALRNSVIAITDIPNAGQTFELSKADWDEMILGTKPFSSLDQSLSVIDQAIGR